MTINLRRRLIGGVAGAAALAVATVGTARKLWEYAADPVGEKDCGPEAATAPVSRPPLVAVPSSPVVRWKQRGGTINDSSCLDRTSVFGVVRVESIDDVREALKFAAANHLKVSIAGVRHSQGGQAFARNAVVLDMTGFNRMHLDAARKVLTVQSGARWHDIQSFLHPTFAVKAMQSTDIFTVGGSISVNAHGMDHRAGSIRGSVRAMRVMLADGTVEEISPTSNQKLFDLVVGGYGLFGVVLDADIDVVDNAVYQSERRVLSYREFPSVFANEIEPDSRYALLYAHLSTAPQSFLDETLLYTYKVADLRDATIPPLGDISSIKLRRLVFNASKLGGVAMRLKWWSERYLEPRIENCSVSRNQAMSSGEACFVSRNEPMHDSVAYLKNRLPGETDILQEYFVPRNRFVAFVDGLRSIAIRRHAKVLNASVRVIHREDNFLTYAPQEMFAIVLYLNQRTDAAGSSDMSDLTSDLIDLTTGLGGRFFLPYQLHYTGEQLLRAYPEIGAFFDAKKTYDPGGIFTSTFYEKYSRLAASL